MQRKRDRFPPRRRGVVGRSPSGSRRRRRARVGTGRRSKANSLSFLENGRAAARKPPSGQGRRAHASSRGPHHWSLGAGADARRASGGVLFISSAGALLLARRETCLCRSGGGEEMCVRACVAHLIASSSLLRACVAAGVCACVRTEWPQSELGCKRRAPGRGGGGGLLLQRRPRGTCPEKKRPAPKDDDAPPSE